MTLFESVETVHGGPQVQVLGAPGVSALPKSLKDAPIAAPAVCTSVFTEMNPEWLCDVSANNGRITCPKCEARLGNYAWSGSMCSCGEWVTPSFQFQLARVDFKSALPVLSAPPTRTSEAGEHAQDTACSLGM